MRHTALCRVGPENWMRPLNKFSLSPRGILCSLAREAPRQARASPKKNGMVLPETPRAMHNAVCALCGVGHERRGACEAHPL